LFRELMTHLRAAKTPPALWLVIDTGRTEPPPPDARAVLQAGTRELFEYSRSVDVVVEGGGVRLMLMRTLLRGMALVTRTSDRLRVHDGIEQAARTGLDAKLVAALRGEARAAAS